MNSYKLQITLADIKDNCGLALLVVVLFDGTITKKKETNLLI